LPAEKIEMIIGPFLTSPLGQTSTPWAKLSPRGEFCPPGLKLSPGVKYSVCPSILLNSRVFTLGDKYHPWGPSSPLGVKFTLGPGVKLRMALCFSILVRPPGELGPSRWT
jgi:hypothetical protein